MNIETLFSTVLKNSEDATRAIETTKLAIIEQVKTSERVAAALEKNADTNAKQTEAINRFIDDKANLERDKEKIDEKYAVQLNELKLAAAEERKKLMRWIIILLGALFIGVGGYTLLSKLNALGLLGGIL